jgi:hypothetical protein
MNKTTTTMIHRKCEFDPSGKYRYALIEQLDDSLPRRVIYWICLNPSTASKDYTDPTLRRIIAFSKQWGYTELRLGNLFAFRSPYPSDLRAIGDPVGLMNDYWLQDMNTDDVELVVLGWGTGSEFCEDKVRQRATQVRQILGSNVPVHCLGKNQDGSPWHPIRPGIPPNTTPKRF